MNKPSAMIIVGAVILLAVGAVAYNRHSSAKSSTARENAARLEQGMALFGQQQYPEALQRLEEIPVDETNDWRIPYYIGSSRMMLKDYKAAVTSLEQALALNSQQAGVLYALGVSHYKLGNIGLAKAYFTAVLEIDPNDEHAKGLRDIMSGLERTQPGYRESDATPPGETGGKQEP